MQNTTENARAYREILFTTEGLEKHISGVIMFDETVKGLRGFKQDDQLAVEATKAKTQSQPASGHFHTQLSTKKSKAVESLLMLNAAHVPQMRRCHLY